MGSIESRVIATIAQQLGIEEEAVALDASIARDLVGSSLYAIETIMALEDEFGIRISDEDIEEIKTVRQAIAHVTRALDNRTSLQRRSGRRMS